MNYNIIIMIAIIIILIIVITLSIIYKNRYEFYHTSSHKSLNCNLDTIPVNVNGPYKIYMAAPMFTTGQRFENAMIAKALMDDGFQDIFLPQSSGIDDLVGLPQFLASLPPFDKLDGKTKKLWGDYIWPIIYCLDLYDLATSDIVILNANGQSSDPGALSEAGLAAAMGKIMVLYYTEYDKTLNPMNVGLTGNLSIPSASSFMDVPKVLKMMIQYRKTQPEYTYKLAPNVKDYVNLGCLIKEWVKTAPKTQYEAFAGLIELVVNGSGKKKMQSLKFNPTSVAPDFRVDNITFTGDGIEGNSFLARFKDV